MSYKPFNKKLENRYKVTKDTRLIGILKNYEEKARENLNVFKEKIYGHDDSIEDYVIKVERKKLDNFVKNIEEKILFGLNDIKIRNLCQTDKYSKIETYLEVIKILNKNFNTYYEANIEHYKDKLKSSKK